VIREKNGDIFLVPMICVYLILNPMQKTGGNTSSPTELWIRLKFRVGPTRKNIFYPSVSYIDVYLDKKYLSIDIF
jgi:hypothetical protein